MLQFYCSHPSEKMAYCTETLLLSKLILLARSLKFKQYLGLCSTSNSFEDHITSYEIVFQEKHIVIMLKFKTVNERLLNWPGSAPHLGSNNLIEVFWVLHFS